MEMRGLTEIIINYINDNFLLFKDLTSNPSSLKEAMPPLAYLPTWIHRYVDT